MIHQAIVRELVEEGAERRVGSVTQARLDQVLPDVLEQFGGGVGRSGAAQQVAIQRVLVAPIQRLERRRIAPRVRLHQCLVAGIAGVRYRNRLDRQSSTSVATLAARVDRLPASSTS